MESKEEDLEMYNLNSVLIEGAVESVTPDESLTKVVLWVVSRDGTGRCLIEVANSDKVLLKRASTLVVGQSVRVVGRMRFSEEGTCTSIGADNLETRPVKNPSSTSLRTP